MILVRFMAELKFGLNAVWYFFVLKILVNVLLILDKMAFLQILKIYGLMIMGSISFIVGFMNLFSLKKVSVYFRL